METRVRVNKAVPASSLGESCENVGVKGHAQCDPGVNSDVDPKRSLELCHIEDAQIVVAAEVSQAVSIMEEILNPSMSKSDVNVQHQVVQDHEQSHSDSVEVVKTQRRAVQEILKERKDSDLSENETLPLAEQSTNEEGGSKDPLLPWVSTYDKVEELVREYEIETTSKFLMGNPDRDFGKTFDEIKHHHHIHLDGGSFGNDLSPKLCLDGMPYIMMGNRRLACHHGKPHYQSSKKVKGKQRLCVQASKKVGCPAHIFIRHVMLLPDFSFDKNKITEHRRRELSKRIKASWKEKHTITTESRFYIEFPDTGSHKNHPLGEAAGVKQPIDKRVNEKMLQLISDGMKSIPLIERSIKDFVRNEIFKDSPCPPDSNRRFFPTQKDITNRIFKVTTNSHSSKLKTDELEESVRAWLIEQQDEEGFVFFRNALDTRKGVQQNGVSDFERKSDVDTGEQRTNVHSSQNGNADAELLPDSSTEGLLFVYQTRHQRRLLERYGSHLTFLDSAHKEAAYPIPLYFLLVNTNCGFYVAAVVAMAKESVGGLQEALGLLREANPGWSPQQFMVEPSELEIQTVEGLFPDCQVYITDTRRQQVWKRFLINPKHRTSKRWQELLASMTSVATARTPEAYQAALDVLRGAWTKPALKQMRAWFREKWMANIQRWAHVYRQPQQLLPLIINNGLESQQAALGYPFIASNRHRTLHGMLDLIVGTVLPKMETRYFDANDAWRKAKDSSGPPLFHNRPQPFIDHCRQRLPLAKRIEKISITQLDQSVFRVPAGDPDRGEEFVDLGVPSCTCEDLAGTGFPCVHLLACIVDGDDVLWERLPSAYLRSPFLTVDDCGEVGGATGGATGEAVAVATGEGPLGIDEEDDECTEIPAEVEATSNLAAILAAMEAHQTPTESANPSLNSTPTSDNPSPDEAARCRAVARELLDLTHNVTDTETLAQARTQMEAVLTTLRRALPRGDLRDPVCHDQTDEEVPLRVMKVSVRLDQDLKPAKRQRLEEQAEISDDRMNDSNMEVDVTGSERTEVYDDRQNLEVDESIVTETIDLQQGAVFILEPSGMMRNVEIMDDCPVGTVIIKDS